MARVAPGGKARGAHGEDDRRRGQRDVARPTGPSERAPNAVFQGILHALKM